MKGRAVQHYSISVQFDTRAAHLVGEQCLESRLNTSRTISNVSVSFDIRKKKNEPPGMGPRTMKKEREERRFGHAEKVISTTSSVFSAEHPVSTNHKIERMVEVDNKSAEQLANWQRRNHASQKTPRRNHRSTPRKLRTRGQVQLRMRRFPRSDVQCAVR